MYSFEDVVYFVGAANLAGQLEAAGTIEINDSDEEFTTFLNDNYQAYKVVSELAFQGNCDFPVWEDRIFQALIKHYGK